VHDSNEIVVDPEVPDAVKHQLKLVPLRTLIRFGASAPSVARQWRWPERTVSANTVKAEIICWVVLVAAGLAALIAFIAATSPGVRLLVLLSLGVPAGLAAARLGDRRTARAHGSSGPWPGRTSGPELITMPRAFQRAASAYHRHYVVPSLDFDEEALAVWERAASAAERIRRSDVVRLELIDSVQVAAVLPYHLWEIAERLARLSALRASHRDILLGIEPGDPDVAAVLEPQRRVHQLAIEDVKQRLWNLEVFAERLETADAARRREKAMRRLSELNDPHRDLVASLDHSGSEEMIKQVTLDAQAIIDQANEAVKQANEVGRNLVLPGDS
jgi:hypothetical protein